MSNKRLLVVEDSKPIALVIERMATSVGYNVSIAPSFAVVKKLLSQDHNFFAATVDYGLPDAPEGQVVPYIIENRIPAIIMTGRMDDGTRKKLLNYPIVDYITKENAQAYHYLMRILHGQLTNHEIGVLVVDDSLSSRNQTKQLLERRNFTVYCVDDGTKALKALEQNDNIKLVITEQALTGMDGIELVQKIRKIYSSTEMVIIGISGSSRNYQSARFIKNGADDFLRTPFCPEEFYCRVIQNIEKLKYMEQVQIAANTDYLTSLYNRRHFIKKANEQLKDETKADLAKVLAVMYVDDFKGINDKYKHQAGDEVLTSFSAQLKKSFKNNAIVSRLGGAEFAVFAVAEKATEVQALLKAFQAEVTKLTVEHDKQKMKFTVSIGGAVIDPKGDFDEALAAGVETVKQATKKGKSQLVFKAE